MASQVYWNGDWWEALETTAPGESPTQFPDKWRKIEIPQRFRRFIVERAYAAVLVANGQNDKAGGAEQKAGMILIQTAVGEHQANNCNADVRADVQQR